MTKKANKKAAEFYGDTLTEEFCLALSAEVSEDFSRRAQERLPFELQWRLNMNFLAGRQYSEINPLSDISESEKQYYWQQREVFNHIAPIYESRCAKLSRVRPKMSVRAFGEEESDIYAAKLSTKILDGCYSGMGLDRVISAATMWSEVCGTAFYKIVWNESSGTKVGDCGGKGIYEGDVSVTVCPPFEIFPENLSCEGVEGQKSIIHARAMHIGEIEEKWGIAVEGEQIDFFASVKPSGGDMGVSQKNSEYAMVLEKYELPTKKYPCGRLIITAGGKLLSLSELPFSNCAGGGKGYPFIKQCSVSSGGCFFGLSVIERCIPVQRAYNAVKNRKHEFLNRLSSGVLAVEDGSTDTDLLEEEGLAPGRVVIYRQGSTPPQMLSPGSIPADFTYEEERLHSEFKLISGVSDVMRNSSTPSSMTSGVALSMLVEQDDTRLSVTAGHIRAAVKEIGRHILRLYRQYASSPRLLRIAGENNSVEQYYFTGKDLSNEDIVFETENELSQSPAQKKALILDMLSKGLLSDDSGRLSLRMKARISDLLGFSTFDNGQDTVNLNIKRAAKENLSLVSKDTEPLEIDTHEIHIQEHIRYMLSGEYENSAGKNKTENFLRHIRKHKALLAAEKLQEGIKEEENE